MSTNVVPPPAASARLPVAAPSHSVRPGSLKCTCTSTTPGKTSRPRSVDLARALQPDRGPTSTIRPPSTARSASTQTVGCHEAAASHYEVGHDRLRATPSKNSSPAPSAAATSLFEHSLVGMMADAARRSQEEHRRRHASGDDHRVVAGAARHAVHECAASLDGPREDPGERGRPSASTAWSSVHVTCDAADPGAQRSPRPVPSRRSTAARRDPVVGMPHVEAREAAAGNDIARARLDVDPADRRHETGRGLRRRLDLENPLRRARQRVAAAGHRRRAGMIGRTGETDVALESDRRSSRRCRAAGRVRRAPGPVRCGTRDSRRASGATALRRQAWDRARSRRIASRTVRPAASGRRRSASSQRADERAAADERHTEAHAFFLRKADDLDGEREPSCRPADRPARCPSRRRARRRTRPACGTVSRCEPMNKRGAAGVDPAYTPRRLPAASTRTVMPTRCIHPRRRECTSRIGGDRNVRVVNPGSSVHAASAGRRR